MKSIRVIALLDGRPGHEKQSLGIVRALKKRIDVDLTTIIVARPSLISSFLLTCRLFLWKKGLKESAVADANLLIGTGSATHLSLLLYKKQYDIPTVTCMDPASYLRSYFDICFVPAHDQIKLYDNVCLTVGAPNCSEDKLVHDPKRGLVLLGGIDPKSHKWDNNRISAMVETIVKREISRKWTIASSPRTPVETIRKMQQLEKLYPHVHFFDYKDTEKGWVERKYNESSVAWVTSDSVSMLSEALSAGCCVGLLPVEWKSLQNKFKKNEDVLLQKNLVIPFRSWEKNDATWTNVEKLNEAQRCADRILQKWWPKSLQ